MILTFLMNLGFPTILPRWFNKKVDLMIGIEAVGRNIGRVIFNLICGMLINK